MSFYIENGRTPIIISTRPNTDIRMCINIHCQNNFISLNLEYFSPCS